MKRCYRLVPIVIPVILLLGLMQLMAAASGQNKVEALRTPPAIDEDHNEGLLLWSQTIDGGEREVLLQWQKMPEPPYKLFFYRPF